MIEALINLKPFSISTQEIYFTSHDLFYQCPGGQFRLEKLGDHCMPKKENRYLTFMYNLGYSHDNGTKILLSIKKYLSLYIGVNHSSSVENNIYPILKHAVNLEVHHLLFLLLNEP